jgi:hypothetical protein
MPGATSVRAAEGLPEPLRVSVATFSRVLHFVAFEKEHPFLALSGRIGFFKNRAKTDIVKRDRQFVLFGEAFYLLLTPAQIHASRPHPRELRIVNGANLLVLQFSFDQVGQLAH